MRFFGRSRNKHVDLFRSWKTENQNPNSPNSWAKVRDYAMRRVAAARVKFGAESSNSSAQRMRKGLTMIAAAGIAQVTRSRRVSAYQAAQTCEDLLRSAVTTPFETKYVTGLFTIDVEPPYPDAPVLVMTHGYGSGSGLWVLNIDRFAKHFRVIAVDWRGCGASDDRPTWTAQSVEEGEAFFIDSLEAWRNAYIPHQSFHLLGHSLGGYLSTSYTIKYPAYVKHLLLVSPAGIPEPLVRQQEQLKSRGTGMTVLNWMWENNVTPQSIVRAMGSFGEKTAKNALRKRFLHVFEKKSPTDPKFDIESFIQYIYEISSVSGSGEYALNTLLAFGAHAREPMGPRILRAVNQQRLNCPITFVYGFPYDWMDARAGEMIAHQLCQQGIDSAKFRIPDSGHHLYLEQPELFCNTVIARILNNNNVSIQSLQ